MLRKLLKKMLNLGIVENYQGGEMVLYPVAKINIGLYVTGKRKDGFHSISSFFLPLKLSDILEIIPDQKGILKSDKLALSGIDIPGDRSDNLVLKACSELRKKISLPFFDIHLHKIIPIGAGLGGGSSDGAEMLMGIQEFAKPLPSPTLLEEIASSLGSDCPFFLNPIGSLATGRGEILKPTEIKLNDYWISIFNPGIHISTSHAYQKVKITSPSMPLEHSIQMPLETWRGNIQNVFETPVFEQYPSVENLKNKLYEAGAIYASMSGSGSSVFGIFKEKTNWTGVLRETHIWTEQI